jgi:hypothetical protein
MLILPCGSGDFTEKLDTGGSIITISSSAGTGLPASPLSAGTADLIDDDPALPNLSPVWRAKLEK